MAQLLVVTRSDTPKFNIGEMTRLLRIHSKSWESWEPDPADNLNFPRKDCLKTRKLSILQYAFFVSLNIFMHFYALLCLFMHFYTFFVTIYALLLHFLSRFMHFFRRFFKTEKHNPADFIAFRMFATE